MVTLAARVSGLVVSTFWLQETTKAGFISLTPIEPLKNKTKQTN